MNLLPLQDKVYWHFDMRATKSAGHEFRQQYMEGKPFPNIVLDNVFDDNVLEMCLSEFPTSAKLEGAVEHAQAQENLKASFNPEYLTSPVRSFFYALNSRPFLAFLENMTGINGLIPDPYYRGGGFHCTQNGGHLGVHADFNYHSILVLERRINVLIYLNKNWLPDYGGQLELWDRRMTHCVKSIDPVFNRMVVFNTDSDSYHGQPDPIRHPNGEPRRSIALYYYTATWDDTKREHTTQFHTRPKTGDRYNYRGRLIDAVKDVLPPILFRQLQKLRSERNDQA
jgi:hypothetical protein